MEQRIPKEEIDKRMTDALFKFSIQCLYKYMKLKPKSDYAFCPYNLYEALFFVYLTSSGAIEQRLKDILFLTEILKDDLIGSVNFDKNFSKFSNSQSASTSQDVEAETNAIYEHESMCWIRRSKFSARSEPMNEIFQNGFEIVDDYTISRLLKTINKKFRSLTKDHICEPVKLSVIVNMDIILATIFRFNREFHNSTIHPDQPSVSDKRKWKNFFCEELSTYVGVFPYNKSNVSLFMLLPASVIPGTKFFNLRNRNVRKLIKRLSTEEGICKLRDLLDSETTSEDDVGLSTWPIFEMEKNLKIRKLLHALGLEQLLRPDAIDLYKFFTRDQSSVQYGNVVHRVRVKVTERSTVAGAMTLLTKNRILPNMKTFRVNSDYPFVWLIYDRQRRDILFIGALKNVSSDEDDVS